MRFGLILFVVLGFVSLQTFAATDKVFCYYGSWATYRNGNGKFDIENIDYTLCTHILYAFVGLSSTGAVNLLDSWNDISLNALNRVVALKKSNSNLKIIVAMGGWNEGSTVYSSVVSSSYLRSNMVSSVVAFCKQYGFDGFDLDWEYPAQRGGASTDKANYIQLLKELRARFDTEGLILTAAVGVAQSHITASYDIPNMSLYLHYILLMAYDLRGTWDGVAGQNAPLYASSKESSSLSALNVDAIVKNWLNQGATASKLVLGIPLYGHSFTLTSSSNNKVGAPVTGAGMSGSYTYEAGNMMYLEICETMAKGGWTQVWDDEQKVPYAFSGNQWIGFDNAQSVKLKAEYAKSKSLGGVMVWSIEQDDARGSCGGGKFPLMSAIRAGLAGTTIITTTTTTTKAPGTTTTTKSSGTTTTTTTKAPTSGNYCTKSGFVRDPYNCQVFYLCELVYGSYVQHKFTCGNNLVFNTALSYCDWPYNVQC